MNEAEFRRRLYEDSLDDGEIEKQLSKTIFILEKELHCHIDDHYPAMKFLNQIDELEAYRKWEEKEYRKTKDRGFR